MSSAVPTQSANHVFCPVQRFVLKPSTLEWPLMARVRSPISHSEDLVEPLCSLSLPICGLKKRACYIIREINQCRINTTNSIPLDHVQVLAR